MYNSGQKQDHIRELQRFLYEISFYNRKIPEIIPDGVYSTETENAVRIFQREYGLPETGRTDSETWKKAAEINSIFYPEIVRPDVYGKDTVLVPGSAGPVMFFIQTMLNTIGRGYANMPLLPLTGVYDEQTERAVNMYKRTSGHDVRSEGIDSSLWNSIVLHFNEKVIL